MASIYDPLRDRVVLFGGYDATSDNLSSFLNDTWELSFRGSLQWTQLAPAGSVPVACTAEAVVLLGVTADGARATVSPRSVLALNPLWRSP